MKENNPLAVLEDEEDEDEPVIVRPTNGNYSIDLKDDREIDEPLEQQQLSSALLINQVPELIESTDKFKSDIGPDGANILMTSACSVECSEALNTLKVDPWDTTAWHTLIEEVERGNGGSLIVPDVYERMLKHFPKSSKYWSSYAEYYIGIGEITLAEEVLKRASPECWSVDIWNKYLSLLSSKFAETLSAKVTNEIYQKERRNCDSMYNIAVSYVGWAIDSYGLWKSYIDFVNSWPEHEAMEAARKITTIRKTFQRALAIPMDQADNLWKEYEAFERSRNDSNLENFLQDTQRRYQHARSILRDRKRHVNQIVFDRVATPSSGSPSEAQQLDLWNNWISHEMGKPDYLNPDSFKPMMRMIYQQCLSCFYYHPEVWIAFAKFEQLHDDTQSARMPLHNAIIANPKVTLLRIALAEVEEESDDINECKEILRTMFEEIPSGFTFSIYQRLIRRSLGQTAARKVFQETLHIRANDASLAIELYMAHATLELEVNSQPCIAMNILKACSRSYPSSAHNMSFLKLLTRILTQLGEKNQLRLHLQTAIDSIYNEEEDADEAEVSTLDRRYIKIPEIRNNSKQFVHRTSKNSLTETKAKKIIELLEMFVLAEITLGSSDLQLLQRLRNEKNYLRGQVGDTDRNKQNIRDELKLFKRGLYDSVVDIIEKYETCIIHALPEYDQELRERCRKSSSDSTSRLNSRRDYDSGLLSLGLPQSLREFIGKLPLALGPPQVVDIDNFIKHVKSVTLPPRPIAVHEEQPVTEGKLPNDRVDEMEADVMDEDSNYVETDDKQDILRQRKQQTSMTN